MTDKSKAKAKVQNPRTHFEKPKDIVRDESLAHNEKKESLDNWEQDERQLLTASNEGMAGGDEGVQPHAGNRLDEVVKAKGQIGEKPKVKPAH